MHTQTKRTIDDKTVVYRSAYEDRQQIISEIGIDEFNSSHAFDELRDLPIPKGYVYIWDLFIDIYSKCAPNGLSGVINITWQDLDCYMRVRNIKLQQKEIDYIIKINTWALQGISKAKQQE